MSLGTETKAIVLRNVDSTADIRDIEDLQIQAWGDAERDIVPLNQLVAARYVGGSLIGAYDNKTLVGFAYGFYGHLRGQIVHHSHMLAVLPAYRNHNLAFRLKFAQRAQVLEDGLTDRITWTFDPLQSLNAYFNFAKLGVVSDVYKINVYGEKGESFLHRNGTDRLFVTWLIESDRVKDHISQHQSHGRSNDLAQMGATLLSASDSGLPVATTDLEECFSAESILIEIPADINSIERQNFEAARTWREQTRYVFREAFVRGFVVTKYFLKNEQIGKYLLEKRSVQSVS